MLRNYNYIYSKMVEGEGDMIGHIAYSLYKKSKIEYIENQKLKGKTVTDDELIPFNDFSSTDSSLETYRIKAEIILQGFIDNLLSEELQNSKEQAVKQQSEILKDIIKPLISGFWKNIWGGVISAFIFAAILAAIAFIIQYQGSSININIDKTSTTQTIKSPHK